MSNDQSAPMHTLTYVFMYMQNILLVDPLRNESPIRTAMFVKDKPHASTRRTCHNDHAPIGSLHTKLRCYEVNHRFKRPCL